MKTLLFPIATLGMLLAGDAFAGLSLMNATCPGGLSIHVDEGGPVYINGREAALKRSNDNYYEAKDAKLGVTISISKNPDGSFAVSYTGKNRVNGICQIVKAGAPAEPMASAPKPAMSRETHPAAEKACLASVAKKTSVGSGQLSVISAEFSEAGTQVKVNVPGADAPWACMVDQKNQVWNVSYTGSEGAL